MNLRELIGLLLAFGTALWLVSGCSGPVVAPTTISIALSPTLIPPTADAPATETQIAADVFATETAGVPTATDTPAVSKTPTIPAWQLTRTALIATFAALPTQTATPTPNLAAPRVQRNRQATATVVACLHQTGLAPADWPVRLCDTFSGNANGWQTGNITDNPSVAGSRLITKGKYRWDFKVTGDVGNFVISGASPASDFYLTVEGMRISSPPGGKYGLVFRYDGTNLYRFEIRDDQSFRFKLNYQGAQLTLIDWTNTPAIRAGASNRLTVIARGSHFTFLINDQQVGEADDNRVSKGAAGVVTGLVNAGDEGVFEFDNFELRAP